MRLDDIKALLLSSTHDDWNRIQVHTPYTWEVGSETVRGVEKPILIPLEHSNLAVYKPDVRISLAWGVAENEEFEESWTKRFPDPSASSICITLRFNGQPIDEQTLVDVDGGRHRFLMPKTGAGGEYHYDRETLEWARFFWMLTLSGDPHEFDIKAKQAGLVLPA